MPVNMMKTGEHIASLRKAKNLTQNELGERLGVSFQAVSKWERGETLPDTALLPDLAGALETTVDSILGGGGSSARYKGRLSVKDMREGIGCLARVGVLLGRQNIIYRHAVDGISEKMNTDAAAMLEDERLRECLIAEAILYNMRLGYYYDLADVAGNFKDEKWRRVIREHAQSGA